jgi:hypothetical protein
MFFARWLEFRLIAPRISVIHYEAQPYLKLAPLDPVRVGGIDLSGRQHLQNQEFSALRRA